MEIGEMGRKEPETEIPWVPTTPAKPILPKSVPICTPAEGNDQTHHHGNEAVACSEFSNGSEKNRESCHGSVPMATIADNASDNGKICEKTGFGNVSCWSDLGGSAKFMFPAEVGSSNSYATQLGNNNGLNDLFVPRVPQETSDNACCSKRTSPDDPTEMLNKDGPSLNKELCGLVVELTGASSPLKENHNPDEGSSLGTGLNKTPEKKPRRKKHRPKVIREGKPKRTPKPATPKPAQSKGNTTGKRKYVRRTELNKAPTPATEVTGELTEKIPEAAEISCRRSLNFEIGTKDESSAGRKSTTGLLDKENGVAVQEPDVGLAFDLYTPGKHPSNSSMSLPEDTQVPDTSSQSIHPEASSQSIHPEAKPKENPTGKKKRVRKKLNKPPTPPTEVTGELTTETMSELARPPCKSSTNFDKGGMEESSTVKENVVIEGTYPDLAYVRRPGLNESSTPTKVSEDLPGKTMPESAKNSCTKSLNFDGGERGESSANRENAIVHPSIETGTALQEIEVDLAYDMKALMKQAAENNYQSFSNNEHTLTVHPCKETGAELKDIDVALAYDIEPFVKQAAENNYMSFFNNEQTLSTSPSKTNSPGEKPRGSLTENTYQRRKRMNKSPTSQTEMTGGLTGVLMTESKETAMSRFSDFDMATKYESSAHRQIVNVQMDDVVEETPVGLAYKDSWMKQALHSYIALPEGERKCVRKRANRTFTPKKMTGELTKPIMSEPTIISCRMSINFDTGGRDESSMCNESLANDQNTLVKEIAHNYTSLSENTQAPSTCLPKSNLLEVKQNARNKNKRKGLAEAEDGNISNAQASTVKLQMIGCEREHSKTTERADNSQASTVNLQMEMVDWEGEHSGTNERADNSGMNLIGAHYNELHSYQSKPPLQFPNTRLPKCNPPGRKRNARNKNKRKSLAEVEDGNISNGQASTVNSQMVGYEGEHSGTTERADNGQASTVKLLMEMVGCGTEHSGTTEHADNSSVNLIGAHSNGFHSYQSKFPPQFLNIQKKRRTEKGKTSNTHITSSVNTKNGVPPIFAPEDAQVHPYASNDSSWMYGLGYNAAVRRIINESRENHFHSTQTFDEFRLSLRRMAEISLLPNQTCDYNSLMRIRNCIEPNYNAKQLDFSDRQTIREAERPQTCTDVLVEDMHVSCAKKKRSRKRSVLSSSMRPNKDEMQQCHNSALGNHQLTLGKPSGTARRVVRKITYNVEALTEQFRQLNINTGGKELALYGQTALVPFQGSFDPIKKQRPRPKVDLDEETDRVWKLLLLDINHDGVDGTDEEKAKWWEGERNVFRGRAESFIARMHLVQGDRRFSRWKGSVVDSVVGVFLTQNVTDHLSSSAFMSLAARFPKKSGSMCGEGTSLAVNKQQVCVVEPEENTECDVNLLNQSVCNQSSMTVDIVEHSREKTVNSNDSCRITSSPISLTDESNCKQTVSPQRNITECHSPMVVIEDREEKSCHDGTGKELNDIVSSQSSVISSQISGDFSNDQNPEKIGSCSDSNSEVEDLSSTAKYNNCGSFSKLLEMVSSTKFSEVNSQRSKLIENMRDDNATESWKKSNVAQSSVRESIIPSHEYNLKLTLNLGAREVNCSDPFNTEALSSGILKNKDENEMNTPSFQTDESAGCVAVTHSQTNASQVHPQEQSNHMQQSFFDIAGQTLDLIQKERDFNFGDHKDVVRSETNEVTSDPIKKTKNQLKEEKEQFDWDSLRRKAQAEAGKREKTEDTMDSLDWDAVRCADVGDIANTIKERGMNNRLAERIQKFLKRVVDDHGSIDLEWLRDVPPDQAKEYLLSVRGLGLKSVECVRLLTLHHLAFPVDTNVGRIAVRLGWVPLQPLPESLQLHLLEMYPVLESIQKYLWPRLCKLDQKTLYELHYQMITFGKVFCTKSKPNCNACPMRAECRHFASAFASARLALPGPEQKSIVIAAGNSVPNENPPVVMSQLQLPLAENTNQVEEIPETEVSGQLARSEINICQPIIEEPTTPEPECSEQILSDIEDAFYEDPSEIPTIKLNIEEFTLNLQNYMQQNMELQEGEMSKALVALNPEAASIPVPKLKNISRLRTEHCVYELPDTHPLLEGWDKREPDDPGKYLLAIWTPGETADSTQAPECKCRSREEYGQLCNEKECFSCNSFREANSQIIRGTLLIPCRTATRGSFPLNGTYFQVNEVFADHESSLNPVSVPRSWIWNLNRRTVYFGTSTTSIFKGLSTQEIQQAFWRGYICVRGFERKLRTPRPLMARLHFPASKLAKAKEKTKKEPSPVKKSQVPKPARKSQEPKPNPEQPELITNGHSLQEKGTA